MRRVSVALGVSSPAVSVLADGLLAVGPGEPREAWRSQAETGLPRTRRRYPFLLRVPALAHQRARIPVASPARFASQPSMRDGWSSATPATLGCPVIAETDRWLREIVQPAAMLYFGSRRHRQCARAIIPAAPATAARCARMSEHAFGNAVDVMSFQPHRWPQYHHQRRLAWRSGRTRLPARGLRRRPAVTSRRCSGRDPTPFHYDHFHLDLARHGRNWRHPCLPGPEIEFKPPDRPGCRADHERLAAQGRRSDGRRAGSQRFGSRGRIRYLGGAPQDRSRPVPQADPFPIAPALEPQNRVALRADLLSPPATLRLDRKARLTECAAHPKATGSCVRAGERWCGDDHDVEFGSQSPADPLLRRCRQR